MINIEKELQELAQYERDRLKYHIPFFVSASTTITKTERISDLRLILRKLQTELKGRDNLANIYLCFLKDLNVLILRESASEISSFWGDLRMSRLLCRMIDLEEMVMKNLLAIKAAPEFEVGYNMTVSRLYSREAQLHGDKGAPGRIAIDDIPETMRVMLKEAAQKSRDTQLINLYNSIVDQRAQHRATASCC